MGDESFVLTGRVAMVTGASRGIGRAIAIGYAAAGARVVLTARGSRDLELVAHEIQENGGEALPIEADITSESDVDHLVATATARFGGIDIAVNNAGVGVGVAGRPVHNLLDLDSRAWQATFAVNCLGPFLVLRAVLPGMLHLGAGRIVNITSRQARSPVPGSGAYGASKAALEQLTRTVALEFGDRGIRCNALSPGGPIDTAIFNEHFRPSGARPLLPPEALVPAAVWLASEESGNLNGALVDCRLFNAALAPAGPVPYPS